MPDAQPKHISLKRLVIVTGLLTLAGCTATMTTSDNPTSALPAAGSTLQVNQQIDLKPGTTRVFLQDGKIVSQINHYHPNCNLEVRRLDEQNWQSISPGSYPVTRTQNTMEQIVRFTPGQETQLASLRYSGLRYSGLLLASEDDGGNSDIYLGMHFFLGGDDPNLMRLSCRGGMAMPFEAKPPSRAEINQSLGQLASITP